MIDHETQLKIQAFLDGELDPGDAKAMAALIAADADAAALHAELAGLRQTVTGAELNPRVPESRDFYWSQIRREIERLDLQPASEPVSVWRSLSAWLKPLGAVAAVAIAGILVWQQSGGGPVGPAIVTAQIDADTITFQDSPSGTTFVWFDYPAQNGVANPVDSNTLD